MIPVRDCSAQAKKSWVSNGTGTLSRIRVARVCMIEYPLINLKRE